MLARNRTSAAREAVARASARSLEDVEVGLQRVADVDVALVAAGPEERLAARDVLDVVGDRRRGRAGRRTRPRRSRRRPGRRRGSRRGTTRPARSARRRRRAGGRACPVGVSTASKAMDPTTVSDHAAQQRASSVSRASCAPSASDQFGRAGGARARRRRAGARAGRAARSSCGSRRAGVNFADTHARENSYLARYELPLIPGAEVAGISEDGRARGGADRPAAATPSTPRPRRPPRSRHPRRRLRRHGARAADPGPDRVAPATGPPRSVVAGESVVVHAAAGGVGSLAVQLGQGVRGGT